MMVLLQVVVVFGNHLDNNKNISANSSNWMMYDAVRDTDGTFNKFLEANTDDAEATASTATITPISNGFTIGNSN